MLERLKNLFGKQQPEEVRSAENPLEALVTGLKFTNGAITKESALNIPAVATSLEFICSTIAVLPIKMYKRVDADSVEEIEDDYRLKLLNEETGDLLDAVQCKKAIISDMLMMGAGYAYLEKNGNHIAAVYYVDEKYVNVTNGVDNIHKQVWVSIDGVNYPDHNVFRVTRDTTDGVSGRGILEQNPLLFNAMYNAMKFENTAICSGTKRGYLKSQRKLDPDQLKRLKHAWRNLYSTDINDSPDIVVLNEGITFEPASATAAENQLNESKQTNSDLVYNLFGLSSALFTGSLTNEAYITAVKTSILPIVRAFDTAINKFFLLEKEKGEYFFAVDVSEILKAGIEDRYRGYEIALKNGWMQVDEIRKRENMKPLGLDFVKLNLADVLYYPDKNEVYTTNTNATYTLGSGGKEVIEDDANRNPQ